LGIGCLVYKCNVKTKKNSSFPFATLTLYIDSF
jgi:hypothetical protein